MRFTMTTLHMTLLFTDDQVVAENTEDNFRSNVIDECNMISSETKVMAFKGNDPLSTKIITNSKIIERFQIKV
jgi:hypothetical protein